jgi:hypothetical protein
VQELGPWVGISRDVGGSVAETVGIVLEGCTGWLLGGRSSAGGVGRYVRSSDGHDAGLGRIRIGLSARCASEGIGWWVGMEYDGHDAGLGRIRIGLSARCVSEEILGVEMLGMEYALVGRRKEEGSKRLRSRRRGMTRKESEVAGKSRAGIVGAAGVGAGGMAMSGRGEGPESLG